MPTVIDSLIVSLGLDPSGFSKGQKQAVQGLRKTEEQASKTAKNMDSYGKEAAQFFSRIRNEVIALAAAFVGASSIKQFSEMITRSDAALGRMSTNLGMSSRQLSAFQGVAQKFGGSASGITNTLKGINNQIALVNSTGQLGQDFMLAAGQVGLDLNKYLNQGTTTAERYMMLVDAISKKRPEERMSFAARLGLSDDDVTLINLGRGKLQALLDLEIKNNEVNEVATRAAQDRQQAEHDLGATLESVGRDIETTLTPAYTEALQDVQKWVQANKDWIETGISDAVKDLSAWVKSIDWKAVVTGTQDFAKHADDAAVALGGWLHVAEMLFELWLGAKFLSVLANVGRLASLLFGGGAAGAGVVAGMTRVLGPVAAFWAGLNGGELNKGEDEQLAQRGFNKSRLGPNISTPHPEREKQAMAYFMAQGWTEAQAAGIVGNLKAESHFDEKAVGDNGRAYGVAQWHPDRQRNFRKWSGFDITDPRATFEKQMEFVQFELTQGSEKRSGALLRGARTNSEAGSIVSQNYERPLDATGSVAAQRGALAASINGVPYDSSLIAGTAATPAAQSQISNTSSAEVSIGSISVNTQATDAQGIFRDAASSARQQFSLAAQAEPGVS